MSAKLKIDSDLNNRCSILPNSIDSAVVNWVDEGHSGEHIQVALSCGTAVDGGLH